MKRISNTRGFTLIELLVVIAIIGILSSVVLASLNTARAKGANAAVKSNLANLRAQAQLFYDNNNSTYGSVAATNSCAATANTLYADPVFVNAIAAITSASAAPVCNSTTGVTAAWAMSAALKTTENGFTHWCVDSAGASKGEAANIGSGIVVCP